ncbi:MAG: phosphate ABC transporter permease PstA [Gammaproteobacteria bacterium]|nr:phosphate ABC transporter permease PstA [Gammaproteobacteria bacterium]
MLGQISSWRSFKTFLFTVFCYLTSIVSILVLAAILWTLLHRGMHGMNVALFTDAMPTPGQMGDLPSGLRDAILGSLIITGIGMLIATPIGILIATYLVDYGSKSKLSVYVRFVNDLLLSAPSIILGLFVYAFMVKPVGNFSGIAGAVALAFIAIPMIVRTTEDVLYLVSPMLKESAIALGIPRWRVTVKIAYRTAMSGMITAILLALARIAGETAPLLFTALNNQFPNANPLQPMANLPVTIFQFAMSPYRNWQHLAWAGALLITIVILLINLIARVFLRDKNAH